MWPSEKMKFSSYVIISVLLVNLTSVIECEISDQRLCGDPECLEPVSIGRTIIDYPSGGSGILSFKKNLKVQVISKSAGSRPDLWGVEIDGKRGYVPKTFIKEEKLLKRNAELKYLVPTSETKNDTIDLTSLKEEDLSDITEVTSSIEQNEKVQLKATDNLQADPDIELLHDSSEQVTDDLKPAPTTYEVVGDTTLYFSNINDHQDKTSTPLSEFKTVTQKHPEPAISTDPENISVSVSISESVEIHSNVKIDVDNGSKNTNLVDDKVDVRLVQVISKEETLNTNSQDIEKQSELSDNQAINVITENLISDGLKLSSENSTIASNEAIEDSKLTLDNTEELSLDTDSLLHLPNTSNENPSEITEMKKSENLIHPEEVQIVPNTLNDDTSEKNTPISPSDSNVITDYLEISTPSKNTVHHTHDIVNNYLFSNPNVINKQSEIINEITNHEQIVNNGLPFITQEKVNSNLVKRDLLAQAENSEVSTQNSKDVAASTEVQDLGINQVPPININELLITEVPVRNNEVPNLDTEDNSDKVLVSESSTSNTNIPLNTPDFFSIMSDVNSPDNLPIEINSDEIKKDQSYLSSSEIFFDSPASQQSSGALNINENVAIQPDSKENVPEINISLDNLKDFSPGNINIETNIEESGNDETKNLEEISDDSSTFVDWMYNLVFGSSDISEVDSVPDTIEDNLHELDNRHDGLLSRFPKDDSVCSGLNSDCFASKDFTKSNENPEDFFSKAVHDLTAYSGTTLIYLTVTAITVLIFTLGYYYIETWRQDGSLLRKVNTLEQALMVSTKECEILKEDLGTTQNKLTSIREGAFGSNEEVISLKEDKQNLETTILEKEKQIKSLQKEFEAATETGLELNKMLHDMMLTAQKGDTIAESMKQAQLQLNEQKETINSMTIALSAKSRENSALQVEQKEYETQVENIQKLLQKEKDYNKSLQEELNNVQNKLEEKVKSLQDQLSKFKEDNSYDIMQLRSVLSETQKDLYAKKSQVQLLEECIKTLKGGNSVEIGELVNVAELQSNLQRISEELSAVTESKAQELEAKRTLEDNFKSLENEIAILRNEHHKAEKDKMEAQTRLEVLSGYFKEKETQLQKELGTQEALWQQKQGEATSTVERLHAMQDEIQSLKSQNQSLRTEIEQQTAAHRTQVTTLEGRVHEAWLSSRQAERKLEESRQEASTLRRKLTSLVEQENMQKRGSSPLDVQLTATSPLHMNSAVSPILPPPPLPFLPPPFLPPPMGVPPPPHFLPPFMGGDMRPPPLGRLPSPPRQRRGHYSPSMASERYSPESRAYSPESRAYSPDSRAYSPDYRRPISPYDTETDISPPASPYRNKYNPYSTRREEQRRPSKGVNSAESTETINRNGRNHTAKAV